MGGVAAVQWVVLAPVVRKPDTWPVENPAIETCADN